MWSRSRLVFGLVAAVLAGAPIGMSAEAQAAAAPACACPIFLVPAGKSVGRVTAATGRVYVTGRTGYVQVRAGSPLPADPKLQITTAVQSSVQIVFSGGCGLSAGSSARLTLSPGNGGICVLSSEKTVGPVSESESGGEFAANALRTLLLATDATLAYSVGTFKSVSP